MKKTLDLLIPNLWKVKPNFDTKYKKQSLKLNDNFCNENVSISTLLTKITPTIEANKSNTVIAPQQAESRVNISSAATIDTWDSLYSEMNSCTKCELCNGRTNVVTGKGQHDAKWMFIGEAPGEQEDLQAKPFVGEAGKLLDKMIAAMNLTIEEDIYITNLIKCRPPKNRNPDESEISQCQEYLFRQIRLIRPKIIITLGRFAAQTLLETNTAIGKLRGKVYSYDGIPLIVTFHPAYLLRKPEDKKLAWDDLQLAMKLLANNV